jgi:hypothetical protein
LRAGSLSDYFVGVGAKVLKDTEVNPEVSRGHEFQGVDSFRAFLGEPAEKVRHAVTYVWLEDETEPEALQLEGTWYDSRRMKEGRDPEYRLYYPKASEEIVYRARTGDTLFLCLTREGRLLALLCPGQSSISQQLLWLFGLELDLGVEELTQRDLREEPGLPLNIAARYVLELIGITATVTEDEWLERLLRKFGGGFPPTKQFSAFARDALTDVDPLMDPDAALLDWTDFEERLFMTLERHLVAERLEQGFMVDGHADVDTFVDYSLSVHNRRKSRAGHSLANHVEEILQVHGIRFKREATTEKRAGPDFLMPGQTEYHTPGFDQALLTMLAVKTSCKDRWRQVLAEADLIRTKHLLTLEPGISSAQTTEMRKEALQLVLPAPLYSSYQPAQQTELMSLAAFLDLVRSRQALAT